MLLDKQLKFWPSSGETCALLWWIAIQLFAHSQTRLEYFILQSCYSGLGLWKLWPVKQCLTCNLYLLRRSCRKASLTVRLNNIASSKIKNPADCLKLFMGYSSDVPGNKGIHFLGFGTCFYLLFLSVFPFLAWVPTRQQIHFLVRYFYTTEVMVFL